MEAINHYPLMKAFLTKLIPKSLRAKMHQHVQFAIDKLDKRLSMKTDRKDFMSYILRHNDDRGLSPKEMQETSRVFVEAGAETTATALCGITYNLLKNPEVLRKLEAEIQGMFKSTEDIQISTVENMKYLPAVIRESLFQRGGCSLRNTLQISLIPYSLSVLDRETALVESKGSRTIMLEIWTDIYSLASMEMRLIISLLLFNFDISLDKKCKKWHDQKIYFLWKKVPLLVHLTPRKSDSG
jgi:hypothetical protein